jgi:multisubunit Na+/H+ antiporter MnhG subunit
MLLFLIFFPRNSLSSDSIDSDSDTNLPTWKEAILVLALSLTFFIFAFLGSVVMVYAARSHLQAWANFLGVTGTLLAAIQYIPQILTTWRLKAVGSLSVPMMCIQTPGSFVFAASLAVRLGRSGWSTWGLFIVTGLLQGCLLGMSLGFLWRERKEGKVVAEREYGANGRAAAHAGGGGSGSGSGGGGGNDEQTPLLSNGDERVAASG